AELTRLTPVLLNEARERGDLYAETTHGAYVRPLVAMAADEATTARGELTDLLRQLPKGGPHRPHPGASFRVGEADRHNGDAGGGNPAGGGGDRTRQPWHGALRRRGPPPPWGAARRG